MRGEFRSFGMRRILFFCMGIVMMAVSGCISDEPELRSLIGVGDPLPEFSIVMNDGETLTTRMLRGSESLIVLFTTWCPDCRRELPRVQAYSDAHPEVRVVCISRSETREDIETLWREENLTLPWSAQPDAGVYSLFATGGVPRLYLASPDLIVTATGLP